jgi:hypothetical protein
MKRLQACAIILFLCVSAALGQQQKTIFLQIPSKDRVFGPVILEDNRGVVIDNVSFKITGVSSNSFSLKRMVKGISRLSGPFASTNGAPVKTGDIEMTVLTRYAKPTISTDPISVGVDVSHGDLSRLIEDYLDNSGYRAIRLKSVNATGLKDVSVFVIFPSPKPPAYTQTEINAVEEYVTNGGGLLCGGQAWSWTYAEYGDSPIETYPLNRLGRVLGFIGQIRDGQTIRMYLPIRGLCGRKRSKMNLKRRSKS